MVSFHSHQKDHTEKETTTKDKDHRSTHINRGTQVVHTTNTIDATTANNHNE